MRRRKVEILAKDVIDAFVALGKELEIDIETVRRQVAPYAELYRQARGDNTGIIITDEY